LDPPQEFDAPAVGIDEQVVQKSFWPKLDFIFSMYSSLIIASLKNGRSAVKNFGRNREWFKQVTILNLNG
jgi:hypothetical protein